MTKALKVTLVTGAALLVVYASLRLGFYLANREYFEGVPAAEILGAFLYGLRFDLAGLLLLNLPVLVAYHLPLPAVKPLWYRRCVFALFALLNALGFGLNIADFGYYPNVQRRLLFEPFSRLQDYATWIPGWVEEYPLLVFGGLAAMGLLALLMGWFVSRVGRRFAETPGRARSHVCAGLLIGLGVLGVRGGLQTGVMRPADAFVHSSSNAVGYLTLNSTYTVLLSTFLPRYPKVEKMPEAQARRVAAGMVLRPKERLLDARYPFLRATVPTGERRPLNVVVLILESWTAANVGPDAQGVSRTPCFDGLAREGAFFTNVLANGQRSSEAVPSIVASLPSLFRRPIIGSQVEMTHFRGLGDILDPFGYRVTFHHGAARTIEGFHGFTSMVGFDAYYSRDDYRGEEKDEDARDGKWGVYDELFFLDAARRMDEIEGPFASVVFGLSPHDPYRLPSNRSRQFEPYAHETPYQRMLRYSDFSVGRFLEYARTRPWFESTIFVLTADHTRFAPPGSFYETFHVPLLIYAPGLVEPQVRPEVGSHVDILPTILDLLRIPTRHASLGRSLLDRSRTHYAVVQQGRRYALFTDTWAYMHDLRREIGLFAYGEDRFFRKNLAAANPQVVAEMKTQLFAYLQAATTAIVEDRVWPGR